MARKGHSYRDHRFQYRVQAELVKLVGKNVRLRKANGLHVDVPLSRLSRHDQLLARCLGIPLLLGAGSAQILLPDSPADEVLVVINGSGSTADDALRDALQMAVHLASGTLVHGRTQVKDHSISEQTLLFSRGFVSHYEILAERYERNSVRRRIAATIQRGAMAQAAASRSSGTSVDASGLYPKAYSKIQRRRNGLPMFEQMLATLPAQILRIELAGTPRLARFDDDRATLTYELTLAIDQNRYVQWQREAVEILEGLATHSGTLEGLSRNILARRQAAGENLFRSKFLAECKAEHQDESWDTPNFPPIQVFQRVSADAFPAKAQAKQIFSNPGTLVVVHKGPARSGAGMCWTWFAIDSPLFVLASELGATVTFDDESSMPVKSERLTIGPGLPGISFCGDGRSEGGPRTLVLSPFFLRHEGDGDHVRDLTFVRSFSIQKQSTLTLDVLSRVKRISVSLGSAKN